MYRVYDDRTNETLYENHENEQCAIWLTNNIDFDSEDFYHIWIERVNSDSENN